MVYDKTESILAMSSVEYSGVSFWDIIQSILGRSGTFYWLERIERITDQHDWINYIQNETGNWAW